MIVKTTMRDNNDEIEVEVEVRMMRMRMARTNENEIHCGLRWPRTDEFSHNNQPKIVRQ